eukprot:Phypoly_transcript_10981.p1 GENE.Phypoly_transcript_10981~~Phypoly_transcript_10981.p1  ORF type:complete len:376 (-),score=70.63 Phypoly_transcript_10981:22-1149(-)
MVSSRKAFSPLQVGELSLQHRFVLAPLTRFRNEAVTHDPRPLMEEYYEQRATKGGLLITEATFIGEDAGGYPHAPGIYSQSQIAKWKKITDRVHKKGGHIYLQLWHIGRAAHSSNIGKNPVSSSDVPISGTTRDSQGREVPHEVPTPLTIPQIKELVQTYKVAAENAIKAGFDGVEIHSANGYLPMQFLEDSVNKRTDEYGGSIENRARFVLEIADAVVGALGPKKVGIRFSPWNAFQSMEDSDPISLYSYTLSQLQERHPDLAYVHLVEPRAAREKNPEITLSPFRKVWHGVLLTCGGYDAQSGIDQIETGGSDLVAFGKLFLANPDLVRRLENGYPLNAPDFKTFYSQTEAGYTDYPFYESTPISVTLSTDAN